MSCQYDQLLHFGPVQTVLARAQIVFGEHSSDQGSDPVVQVQLPTAHGRQEADRNPGEPRADEEAEGAAETVGSVVTDPEYIKKQQEANTKAAEAAKQTGQSNIPVPIAPAENQTLTLSATGFTSGTQVESITAGAAVLLVFATAPPTVPAGGCSPALAAQAHF